MTIRLWVLLAVFSVVYVAPFVALGATLYESFGQIRQLAMALEGCRPGVDTGLAFVPDADDPHIIVNGRDLGPLMTFAPWRGMDAP